MENPDSLTFSPNVNSTMSVKLWPQAITFYTDCAASSTTLWVDQSWSPKPQKKNIFHQIPNCRYVGPALLLGIFSIDFSKLYISQTPTGFQNVTRWFLPITDRHVFLCHFANCYYHWIHLKSIVTSITYVYYCRFPKLVCRRIPRWHSILCQSSTSSFDNGPDWQQRVYRVHGVLKWVLLKYKKDFN